MCMSLKVTDGMTGGGSLMIESVSPFSIHCCFGSPRSFVEMLVETYAQKGGTEMGMSGDKGPKRGESWVGVQLVGPTFRVIVS